MPNTEITIAEDLVVRELRDGVWLHTSQSHLGPANGLILVNEDGAVIVDTPWTDGQTAQLIDWIQDELQTRVEYCVVTHFHSDCMGAIRTVHERGIATYGSERTAALAESNDKPPPARLFSDHLALAMGADTLEVFFPGPAHITRSRS